MNEVPRRELAVRLGVDSQTLGRALGGSRPLSSTREDGLALLVGETRGLCACECWLRAARMFRPGHARRRNGESISRTMLARTRDPELANAEKPCQGCGKIMRRADSPLSDRNWLARRLCSRRFPGATRQANIALAAR